MKNMSLQAICRAVCGTYYGSDTLCIREVSGVAIDSRKVELDYLFVPIHGARVDGHDFISQVMASGALCTLSEHLLDAPGFPYILVDSCAQALKDLAEHYRTSLGVKVIGITGSVGKTSTKEMLASVLDEKYCVLKTEGNYNNEIGLPLTIFNLKETHEIAILEMGINNFGEMHRLAKIARPDICMITNIGCCHLEFLKTQEGILNAKSEIFDFIDSDAQIILNGDDHLLSTLTKVKSITPFFFGLSDDKSIYADHIENLGLKGTKCTFHLPDGSFEAVIAIPGSHMVSNALAGASAGYLLGLTHDQIKHGIEKLLPVSGRNHIIETSSFTIIDDCYNANPVSMKASLDVLSLALGHKTAILGDMGELGPKEKALHYEVGEYAGACALDCICCIGPLSSEIAAGAKSMQTSASIYHFPTKEDFLRQSKLFIPKGSTILVKASHAMDFSTIVNTLGE